LILPGSGREPSWWWSFRMPIRHCGIAPGTEHPGMRQNASAM